VNITTLNEEVNAMLSPGGTSSTQQMSQGGGGGGYLMGYTLRDSGFISLPLIGNVFVYEKTMEEATKLIEEKVAAMLKDATVVVKLLSYRITVLGEVSGPGTFTHYGNQLTVFDAIGMAGDLTDLGNRGRVLVVRPTKEGSTTYRINLKDKNLLVSDAYFLLPNDIIIVEPRKSKLLTLNAPTISLFFSTVFSTISLTLLILNLYK
jgi:polysaccharide export outer membrane protein